MPTHSPPFIIPPTASHTHTIILLHGRGSSGPAFAEELLESATSSGLSLTLHFPSWKFVFPTALERRSTVFKEEMTEWFDIYSLTTPGEREELQIEGLSESVGYVRRLVGEEVEEVGGQAGRVWLGGISQGCATGVHVLLSGGVKLGGFVGLSSWMPLREGVMKVAEESKEEGKDLGEMLKGFYEEVLRLEKSSAVVENGREAVKTKVFLGHCVDDDIVDVKLGRDLWGTLLFLGMDCVRKDYKDGGHWINEPEGMDDIVHFLERNA